MRKTLRAARALRWLDEQSGLPSRTTPDRQAAAQLWLKGNQMGRPRISDGTPLAIRLDASTRARLEALRTTLVPGLEVTLAQVVRAALSRGLDEMEDHKGLQDLATSGLGTPRQAAHATKQRRSRRK